MDNLYILQFKKKHLPDLLTMHSKRENALGEASISMQELPKIGYVAYLGKQPVAAGFMRRVEPSYAQFDTFLSDPFFGSKIRHEALKMIVDQLIEDARDLKVRGVIAFTTDEGILDRALSNGFSMVDHVLLAKRL